jgi:hypothetical protein
MGLDDHMGSDIFAVLAVAGTFMHGLSEILIRSFDL